MTVKRRPYRSPVRREQAERTRARILESASRLFEETGYARTTVKEIADGAGVAADTVYAVFGSKPRVLTALIDQRLTAGAPLRNVTERAEALAIRDEPDQRRQVALFAADMTATLTRVRPFYLMMRDAAAVDEDMAGVFDEMQGNRRRNVATWVGWIAARGPLRVPVDRAADIVWAVASPEMSAMLIDAGGWSDDEYTRWLEDTLARTLLSDPPGRRKESTRPGANRKR